MLLIQKNAFCMCLHNDGSKNAVVLPKVHHHGGGFALVGADCVVLAADLLAVAAPRKNLKMNKTFCLFSIVPQFNHKLKKTSEGIFLEINFWFRFLNL